MAPAQQYCTFYLDGLFFGVEVEKVQEVIRYQEMTFVPQAAPEIRGLINLRGQIVTAIDLRTLLDLRPRAEDDLPMNVVIRTVEGPISMLVDEIGDVLEVEESIYESTPETINGTAKELVRGIYKLEGVLLLILDTDRAMNMKTVSTVAGESEA